MSVSYKLVDFPGRRFGEPLKEVNSLDHPEYFDGPTPALGPGGDGVIRKGFGGVSDPETRIMTVKESGERARAREANRVAKEEEKLARLQQQADARAAEQEDRRDRSEALHNWLTAGGR